MHQQVRTKPRLSPADVERVLRFLAEEPLEEGEIIDPAQPIGVNIVAAGGSRVELGGQFAFVPYHDPDDEEGHSHAAAARRALEKGGYSGQTHWWNVHDHPERLRQKDLEDRAGTLLEFVREVRAANGSSRRIKDILVGTQRIDGLVPVQIYSVPVDDPDQDNEG